MNERAVLNFDDYSGYPEEFWEFACKMRASRNQKEIDDAAKRRLFLMNGEYSGPGYYEAELAEYVAKYEKLYEIKLSAE